MSETQSQRDRALTVDGVTINVSSLPEAVSSIVAAARQGDSFSVCTLNLDHVVQLQRRSDFRAAYRKARFVTADGFPIVMLGRLRSQKVFHDRAVQFDQLGSLVPEQEGVMYQRGETIDVLAEALIGAKLMYQAGCIGREQEGVAIQRVAPGLGQGGADGWKPLLRNGGKDEIVGS